MAGGSADAAAALLAFDRLHDAGLPDDVLLEIAAELGSDVPFSLVGGTARGRGRGEVVRAARRPRHLVVGRRARPTIGLLDARGLPRTSTSCSPTRWPSPPSRPTCCPPSRAASRCAWRAPCTTTCRRRPLDLRPELGTLIDRGESEGALRGIVSGSGPTCIFLCDSLDGAHAVVAGLQGAGHDVVLIANGPVAGAHLLERP